MFNKLFLVLALTTTIFNLSCKKNPTSIVNTEPTASFTIDPTSGTIATIFNFDASSSSDTEDAKSTLQVRWDWENDGIYDTDYSTTKIATHQYTSVGTYTVKLEVKDSGGLANTTTKSVSLSNTVPTASFTILSTFGTTATTFTFNATGSSDNEDATSVLQVRWDWENDGTYDTDYSTTKIATHQYTSVGTYTVKLEVKDSGGLANTTTKSVSVSNAAPTVSFTISPTSGTIATIFNFDASSCNDNEDATSVLQVRWDWTNDGTYDTNYSTTKTATHQYSTTGTYKVKLEVKDSDGLTNTTTKTVSVSNTAPTASFTISPTSGTTATTFTFNATGNSDNEDATSVLQVRWDWENDGTYDTNYSTTKTTTHQYTSVGTYTVKLEVKDSEGLTNTTTKEVIVGIEYAGTVTDIDGNVYNTIQIGDQLWMAENLKVTHYNNGEVIPNITIKSEWESLNSGAYCSYNNDDSKVFIYGGLYNWYAVDDSRGLAPIGWHIPSDEEWKQLEMYLGMSQYEANQKGYRGTDEGRKLKSTTGWYSSGNGTNESGFSALPGGYRAFGSTYYNMDTATCFWSSTAEYNSGYAWYRELFYSEEGIYRTNYYKYHGYSVRCVEGQVYKNTAPTASFTSNPTSGTINTTFTFDASGSSDTEDATSELQVRWDWENDGTYDTNWSTTKMATHRYSSDGTYIVKLEVGDSGGLTNTTVKSIVVETHSSITVTDVDGNIYNTIQIGNQLWMAENLKVTHYRNGDAIPNITDNTQWSNLSDGAYCNWGNNTSYVNTYGRLYNWYVIDDHRGLAPQGWHVASDQEWKILETFLGMSYAEADNDGYRGTDEGKKLKSSSGWDDCGSNINPNGNNLSGFTALPGGERDQHGGFCCLGGNAFFWTSTTNYTQWGSSSAWYRNVNFNYDNVYRKAFNKKNGYSIRCIKN